MRLVCLFGWDVYEKGFNQKVQVAVKIVELASHSSLLSVVPRILRSGYPSGPK